LDFLNEEHNKQVIDKLLDVGVSFPESTEKRDVTELPLSGQTWVVTGTLEKMNRQQVKELLQKFGAKVAGSVSKKTTCLVAGASAGSKLSKAESLGITILDEIQLIERLEELER
jgi:DNA ligase (NAD+)